MAEMNARLSPFVPSIAVPNDVHFADSNSFRRCKLGVAYALPPSCTIRKPNSYLTHMPYALYLFSNLVLPNMIKFNL